MPVRELKNLQVELLKLYSTGISERNLNEIKLTPAKYFAEKASDATDDVREERNLTGRARRSSRKQLLFIVCFIF